MAVCDDRVFLDVIWVVFNNKIPIVPVVNPEIVYLSIRSKLVLTKINAGSHA